MVMVIGLSTNPSTVSVQVSASISKGSCPLLRMKCRSVGVIASSSRCGGRLGVHRPVVQQGQTAVLARKRIVLREGSGHEAGGDVLFEGNRETGHGTHRGEACAAHEAAAIGTFHAVGCFDSFDAFSVFR